MQICKMFNAAVELILCLAIVMRCSAVNAQWTPKPLPGIDNNHIGLEAGVIGGCGAAVVAALFYHRLKMKLASNPLAIHLRSDRRFCVSAFS